MDNLRNEDSITIVLKKPVDLADGNVLDKVTLFEPTASAMRGLNRYDILVMNDDAHKKLLPRISQPSITAAIFDKMSLRDTQKIMTEVTSFFVDADTAPTMS